MNAGAMLESRIDNRVEICAAGPTSLVWLQGSQLQGVTFWGHLKESHVSGAIRALGTYGQKAKSASVIDVRHVETVDPSAFQVLSRFVRQRAKVLRERVSAQALVRPDGLVGAAAAGFYRLLDPPYPVEIFVQPSRALEWLGIADASELIIELERSINALLDTSTILCELRGCLKRCLKRCPRTANLNEIAEGLGMSGQTLQRRLRKLNTTFREEHNAAQIRLAKELLHDTNYDVKRIAFEVGCSSAAAFSALFGRVTGQSPTTWRNRCRRIGPTLIH